MPPRVDRPAVPLLEGARALAEAGFITGASGRNWASYGGHVRFDGALSEIDRALLCDPQTSGGLLVSCAADSLDEVLAIFHRHGLASAAVVGKVEAGGPGLVVA